MDGQTQTAGSQPSPLDAERERLRKAGYNDAEISQILIAKEMAAKPQAASSGHGAMSGVASNLAAAAGYAQNFIPSLAANLSTIKDKSATTEARTQATLYFALKVVVVLVIGYVILQEFSQLRSMTARASAEACIAKQKVVMDNMPAMFLGTQNDTNSPQYKRWRQLKDEYNQQCAGG